MNRSQRRAAARQKPMRLGYVARPRTPLLHEVDQVFAPIDQFIAQLKSGEVWCDSTGCVLFKCNEGALYEAAPAVLGFAEVWEKLAQKFSLDIDTVTLHQWANRLKYNMPIDPAFVEQLELCIDGIRSAYRRMDVYQTKSIVRTEEIRIKCEELGLIK